MKNIAYDAKVNSLGENKKISLRIQLPKPYYIVKKDAIYTGDYHTEMRVFYSDSSIFYITNNNEVGSRLNYANRLRNNHNSYMKKGINDTISIKGFHDKKYWREILIGEVAMGYTGADSVKKELFDNSIKRFIRK